jgi:hypothetical protein
MMSKNKKSTSHHQKTCNLPNQPKIETFHNQTNTTSTLKKPKTRLQQRSLNQLRKSSPKTLQIPNHPKKTITTTAQKYKAKNPFNLDL